MQAGNNEATFEWPRSFRSILYEFFQPWEAVYRQLFERSISTNAHKAADRTAQAISRVEARASETTKLAYELIDFISSLMVGIFIYLIILALSLALLYMGEHLLQAADTFIVFGMKLAVNIAIITDSLLVIIFIINSFIRFIVKNMKEELPIDLTP